MRQNFTQTVTIAGTVRAIDEATGSFTIQARSGDQFTAFVGVTTSYQVVTNLDQISRDRVPDPAADPPGTDVQMALRKYIQRDRPVFVAGLYQEDGDRARFEARTVYLLHSAPDRYLFEETHWWLVQVTQMADRILDHLFDERRNYTIDDFAKFYRTNLNILGQPVDDDVQECAVLSRLLYDLSTAFLITGAERYFLAAQAAVKYLREAFRSSSHDGEYCFWAYGRRRHTEGEKGESLFFASQGPDDVGTIPLYEQIYAIAGLTQYYRITLDTEVLEDIRRTIQSFQAFYWDPPSATAKGFAGKGGYYSHLDPVTMRPDTPALGENCRRKNWNSIGDHIPAYLVNLILTLEPLPGGSARPYLADLLKTAVAILEETTTLIVEKFPDPSSKYVKERFHDDWTPDLTYRWQQDRAVVGHNLKIAWNLTRCANYFHMRSARHRAMGHQTQAVADDNHAKRLLQVARKLGDDMATVGLDAVRGGIFDCVERHPSGGMPIQFAWGATKDFWQQEQGVLAYLILHGATVGDSNYLQLARECAAFWNLFFLDRERQGYYFRTTENGLPILDGQYGMKSSHAIGYHAFELAYLAHVYIRTFVDAGNGADNGFCLYFRIRPSSSMTTINVLPDFMPPGRLSIERVVVNGIDMTAQLKPANPDDFQISLANLSGAQDGGAIALVVQFAAIAN
ncbi:AGE family epimerase/isomerase [Rhodoplanes azumiensis]|uniref:AGE family epimerase/isomerase n=1 Tax=Rhodoplanes azumiensis TaxID=1897628 RepID=A0ABW5AHH2_9BRAD